MCRRLTKLALILMVLTSRAVLELRASDTPSDTHSDDVSGMVLEVTLPIEGVPFSMVWTDALGNQWEQPLVSRKGLHLYELRDHPAWYGAVRQLTIRSFSGIEWNLRQPSLRDEAALFFAPEPWTFSTVSWIHGPTLFGWHWNAVATVLFILTALTIGIQRRQCTMALFISLVLVSFLLGIRDIPDHVSLPERARVNELFNGVAVLNQRAVASTQALSSDGWTVGRLNGIGINLLNYDLAEYQWCPDPDRCHPTVIDAPANGPFAIAAEAQP